MMALKKEPRISNLIGGLMVGTALLFDLLQALFTFISAILLPVILLTYLVTFISFVVFGLWFQTKRVHYFTGKRAAFKLLVILGTIGIELIPLLNMIPTITAGVIMMIIASRIEDALQTDTEGATELLTATAEARGRALANATSEKQRAVLQQRFAAENLRLARAASEGGTFDENYVDEPVDRNAAEKKDAVTKQLESMREATYDPHLATLDPSRYGLRSYLDQEAYQQWYAKKSGKEKSTGKQNVDIPKGPEPDQYR